MLQIFRLHVTEMPTRLLNSCRHVCCQNKLEDRQDMLPTRLRSLAVTRAQTLTDMVQVCCWSSWKIRKCMVRKRPRSLAKSLARTLTDMVLVCCWHLQKIVSVWCGNVRGSLLLELLQTWCWYAAGTCWKHVSVWCGNVSGVCLKLLIDSYRHGVGIPPELVVKSYVYGAETSAESIAQTLTDIVFVYPAGTP